MKTKTRNRLTPVVKKPIKTKKSTGNGELKSNKEMQKHFRTLASAIISRNVLAGKLGKSFGEDRDLYRALGWNKAPSFDDYNARYRRDGIGKRVVDAPVTASWRLRPSVEERVELKEGEERKVTDFEKQWKVLVDGKKIYHYLIRADKLSGIGQYGILLLGFNDANNANMELPAEDAKELMWMRPYSEKNASIKSYVTDPSDERYGLPEMYEVQMGQSQSIVDVSSSKKTSTIGSKQVHWTRVLHVAEELLEDDVNGTPRMESVLNWLYCLEMVSGSSAEIWWRAAFPGLAFILDKEAQFDGTQTMALLQDEIEKYTHDLQRWMRLQGMEVKSLASDVADPSNHVKIYISLIAGSKGIPQRILIGSEAGHLASSQDETSWNKQTDERRRNYCEPTILRAFIERLGLVGVMGIPDAGYNVNWEDIVIPTDKEKAEVRKINSDALAVYANSVAASDMVPPEIFYKEIMGWDDEKIKKISEAVATEALEQEERAKEDEKIRREEEDEDEGEENEE